MAQVVKNPPAMTPVSGRSPGVGNGNPLQYSCLGKSRGQSSVLQSVGLQGENTHAGLLFNIKQYDGFFSEAIFQ